MVLTFSFFAFSCVFFRAGSLDHAFTMLGNIPRSAAFHGAFFQQHFHFDQFGITSIFVVGFLWADHLLFRNGFDRWVGNYGLITRWSIHAVLLFCIFCLSGVKPGAFVYNQF